MVASRKKARQKLSTTVSSEAHEFLLNMVKKGEATTLADAIDSLVARVRRLENRRRLAAATAAYFEQLDPAAALEEQEMGAGLSSPGSKIDF